MGMLRVMSRRGDDRVTWDVQKVQEGDPEATAAVREAERIFAQERAPLLAKRPRFLLRSAEMDELKLAAS